MTTINETAFLELTDENQEKVLQIYAIANLLKSNNIAAISPQRFDILYGLSLSELNQLSEVYHDILER